MLNGFKASIEFIKYNEVRKRIESQKKKKESPLQDRQWLGTAGVNDARPVKNGKKLNSNFLVEMGIRLS